MKTISSRDNARMKHAHRVRDGKERGSIFVEGSRLVGEALRSEVTIDEAYFSETFLQKPEHRRLTEEVARERANNLSTAVVELLRQMADEARASDEPPPVRSRYCLEPVPEPIDWNDPRIR